MKGIFLLFDDKNNEIKKLPANKLSYKRCKIIEKSITCFGDNDPCIIHSTYCVNILSIELMKKLKTIYTDNKEINLPIEEIPDCLKELIEFADDVKAIKII